MSTTVTIGTGTSTGYNAPYNNYYRYSTNETIYTSSEIGTSGKITAIAYNVAASASLTFTSLKIYMAHRSSSTFSSATDYVAYSDMTLVYSATSKSMGSSTGWESITLDTPFTYNGTSNLAIIVCKQCSSYSSTLKYYYTSTSSTVLYRQNDNTTGYADASSTSYSFTLSAYRPNIKLTIDTVSAPSAPTNLKRTSADDSTSVTLSWSASSNATGYKVYKDGTLVSTQTGTTYSCTVSAMTSYTFAVSAYNSGGESSKTSITVKIVVKPSQPTNFVLLSQDYTTITLSWSASNYASGYKLYRDNSLISTQTGTQFTETITPFVAYSYSLLAYNDAGESDSVNLAVNIEVIPKVPEGFTQGEEDYTTVSLGWNQSDYAAGYKLYRDGELVAALNAVSYTDEGLLPTGTYTYKLIAYNSAGDSDGTELVAKTLEAYYIAGPEFKKIVIDPNPVVINGKFVLTAVVEDSVRILIPEKWYSGEIYSGEV